MTILILNIHAAGSIEVIGAINFVESLPNTAIFRYNILEKVKRIGRIRVKRLAKVLDKFKLFVRKNLMLHFHFLLKNS